MVGAGISLCLDVLHRSEAEPEFVEHRKLVDQAIGLLGRYDGSTMALRGIRLLSWLLREGTTKQPPPKHRARSDKESKAQSHEFDLLSWPLETAQSIDDVCGVKQSDSREDGSLPSEPTTVPAQRGVHLRNTLATSIARDADVLDVPIQCR